jgi:hypothetical protein
MSTDKVMSTDSRITLGLNLSWVDCRLVWYYMYLSAIKKYSWLPKLDLRTQSAIEKHKL